jgi:hypothetical protein
VRKPIAALAAAFLVAGLALWLKLSRDPAETTAEGDGGRPAKSTSGPRPDAGLSSGVRQAIAAGAPSRVAGVLAAAKWGSGPGELGLSKPEEGNPEGPMSFAVDREGRLHVLDQANGRIARFDRDGKPLAPIDVSQRVPQDVLTLPDGRTLVLDRLGDQSIAILGPDGKPLGEIPLVGKGIEEGGGVTGMFADKDGIYVEREHGEVVKLADGNGAPDPNRPELDGRPTRDGRSLLSAGLIDPAAGRVWVRLVDRQSGDMRFMRELGFATPVLSIVLLDSDPSGGLYLGAHVGREAILDGGGAHITEEAVEVACLSSTGDVTGVAVLPANTGPEESFRDIAVLDDGTIVYVVRTASGAEVRRYRCA